MYEIGVGAELVAPPVVLAAAAAVVTAAEAVAAVVPLSVHTQIVEHNPSIVAVVVVVAVVEPAPGLENEYGKVPHYGSFVSDQKPPRLRAWPAHKDPDTAAWKAGFGDVAAHADY